MKESRELRAARRALADAENDLGSADGLARLAEGLALLEDVAETAAPAEARTARNLAASYASKVYGLVASRIAGDRQVPEPELEHYFKVVLAFDALVASLPAAAAELKIAVVRALIERYYEGHAPEKKRAALAELDALAQR